MGWAGLPATTVQGATSRETTAPAATTAPSPIFTPGKMIAREHTHAESPISIGFVTSSNESLPMSCDAVQINAPSLITTLDPILMSSTE